MNRKIYQMGISLLFLMTLNTRSWAAISKQGVEDVQRRFLAFCDLAVAEFNKEITRFADREDADTSTHHVPFFEDAHAVRALAVAYDLTARQSSSGPVSGGRTVDRLLGDAVWVG